jgi:hypothetical protein
MYIFVSSVVGFVVGAAVASAVFIWLDRITHG